MAEVCHHKNPIENYASNTYNRMTAAIIWFSDTFLFTLSSSFICAKSSPRDSDELKKKFRMCTYNFRNTARMLKIWVVKEAFT